MIYLDKFKISKKISSINLYRSKRKRGKRNKGKSKRLAARLIFHLKASRNNFFVNITDFKGNNVFRSSGGKICYSTGQSRRTKKSKNTLSLITLHVRFFLKSRKTSKIAFIFKARQSLCRFFFFKVLQLYRKRALQQARKKPKCVFVRKVSSFPHGGCRAGKRRNFRSSKNKKVWHHGRWGRALKKRRLF